MVSQLHCAVLGVICQMDAVQLLKDNEGCCQLRMSVLSVLNSSPVSLIEPLIHRKTHSVYLIVFDSLGQGFHLNSLIKLVFMQQVYEVIQRALMEAHFRVQCTHALKNLHTASTQSPGGRRGGS